MFGAIQTPNLACAAEEVMEQLVKKFCDVYDQISPDLLQEVLRLRRPLAATGMKHEKAEHRRLLNFCLSFIAY